MVGVPADGPGDVQRDLREESQQGGDFVADHLGGVVVAVVHQRDALFFVHGGVGQRELGAAHRISLHTDAEHLGFHAGLDLIKVIRLRQDFINAGLVALAGTHAVGGNVLEAVAGPYIHGTGLAQLLGQILADADAGLAMLHPEAAGVLVGAGQRQRVALGMTEKGRVEVRTKAVRLAELHPPGKVAGFQLVPVRPVAVLKDGVAGVQVDFLGARAELQHFINVGHQLFRRAGAAGVVAGGLDAAGQRLAGVGIKAAHVIPLPAVQADGNGLQPGHGGVNIHAEGGVGGFCGFVAHCGFTSLMGKDSLMALRAACRVSNSPLWRN